MIRISLLFAAVLLLANSSMAQRGWGQFVPRHEEYFKTAGKTPTTTINDPRTIDDDSKGHSALRTSPSPAGQQPVLQAGDDAVVAARVFDNQGRNYPVAVRNGLADLSGLRPGTYNVQTVTQSGRINSGRFVKS